MFVVLGWHDSAVVELQKLCRAVWQQDKASHEGAPVEQMDIEEIGARCQTGQPEEAVRIGLRSAQNWTAAAYLDDRAVKNPGIHRVDYASDQIGGAGGHGVEDQKERQVQSKRPFLRPTRGHAHRSTNAPAFAAAPETGFGLSPPMARASRTLIAVFS